MNTFSAPCEIAVLDDGRVSLNIRLSEKDKMKDALLVHTFAGMEIDEDYSLLNVACLSEGIDRHAVVISALLKLKIKNVPPKARISDVVFLGQCRNCDAVVDISDKLLFGQKKKLIDSYGADLQNDVWTCRYVSTIAGCPHCNP